MQVQSLIPIASFDNPILAHIARNKLQSHDIPAFLDGEYHVAMDWMVANAVGGIKLLVANDDKQQAMLVIDCPPLTSSSVTKTEASGDLQSGDEGAFCCLVCDSEDTCQEKFRKKLVLVSILLIGIPLPFISRRYVCQHCGHAWRPRRNMDEYS